MRSRATLLKLNLRDEILHEGEGCMRILLLTETVVASSLFCMQPLAEQHD